MWGGGQHTYHQPIGCLKEADDIERRPLLQVADLHVTFITHSYTDRPCLYV